MRRLENPGQTQMIRTAGHRFLLIDFRVFQTKGLDSEIVLRNFRQKTGKRSNRFSYFCNVKRGSQTKKRSGRADIGFKNSFIKYIQCKISVLF